MAFPYRYEVERAGAGWLSGGRSSRANDFQRSGGREKRGRGGRPEEGLGFIKYRGGIYSLSKAGSSERGRKKERGPGGARVLKGGLGRRPREKNAKLEVADQH